MENIGLEAIFADAGFQSGISGYSTAVIQAQNVTVQASGEISHQTQEIDRGWQQAAGGIATASTIIAAAMTAILTKVTMVAARNMELGIVLNQVGSNIGKTAEEMDAYVEGIKSMGITTSASRQAAIQMVQAQIDLKHATDLARLAQDAAVIAQLDSSQAFQRLITTIQRGSTIMARTLGLVVDFQGAYKAYADSVGKSTLELTQEEKMELRVQEVMRNSQQITGTYEAAMGSAGKQMRSMKRYTEELAAKLGDDLVPVLGFGVRTLTNFYKMMLDMDPVLRSTGVQTLAVATAILTVGKAATLTIPKLIGLVAGLGPLGLAGAAIAAIAGLAFYMKEMEDAHQEEAASILAASESYDAYIKKLEDAGLLSYALSEALYEVAKGADAAEQAARAMEFEEAKESLKDFIEATWDSLEASSELGKAAEWVEMNMGRLQEELGHIIPTLTDVELAVLDDKVMFYEMGQQIGRSREEIDLMYDAIHRLIGEEENRRRAAEAGLQYDERRQSLLEQTQPVLKEYGDTLRENANWTDMLAAAEKARNEGLKKLLVTQKEYKAELKDIAMRAAQQMVAADQRAAQERVKLEKQANQQLQQLRRDHGRRMEDIEEEIAKVPQQLAMDILKAEEEMLADREALRLQGLAKLAEFDKDAAKQRLDLGRDLNRSLVKLHDDLQVRLTEVEAKGLQEREELNKEHAERLKDINERYAQEVQDINKKYSMEPEAPDFDERREALQDELRRLQGDWRLRVRSYGRIEEIKRELEELKTEELAALDERKTAELEALKQWLSDEQKVRDEALAEQRQKEIDAYNKRVEEAKARYREQLNDLNERLAEQRVAIEKSNADQLAALETRLAEEEARLVEAAQANVVRLDEQLQAERENYAQRYQDLVDANADRLVEINTALDQEKEDIRIKAQQAADEYILAIEGIGPDVRQRLEEMADRDLQPALDDWVLRFQDMAARAAEAVRQAMEAGLESGSPSKWALRLGANVGTSFGQSLVQSAEGSLKGFQFNLGRLMMATPPTTGNTVEHHAHYNLNADFTNSNMYPEIRDQFRLMEFTSA